MGEAFQCDRCEELFPGSHHQTIAWGRTKSSSESKANSATSAEELCEDCWNEFMTWFKDAGGDDG